VNRVRRVTPRRRSKARITVTMVVLVLAGWGSCARATGIEDSYWLLLREDGHTWCGYVDQVEFTAEVSRWIPLETATMRYSTHQLIAVSHQVQSGSGDWIVIDQYTPESGDWVLQRTSLLTQRRLQVIQQARIHAGVAAPFRRVRITALDRRDGDRGKVDIADEDLPAVPVQTSVSRMAFVSTVATMRRRSISRFCGTAQ